MNNGFKRFYEFDSFRLDVAERQLWQAGKPVFLTPKGFDMLLVLLENKGETIEKVELIKKVWADTYVEEGSLNRNISTLRKALGDDSHEQKFIKTLPKRGYQFTAQVTEVIEEIAPVSENKIEQNLSAETKLSPSAFFQNRAKILFTVVSLLVLIVILGWMASKNTLNKVDLSGLPENERRQLTKYGSANTEAYENYVKGRSLWHQRSAEGLHQSIIHLENAVKTDPNFALAHAALADAYVFDVIKWKDAERHAQEAISLNPNLGESHATIGFIRMFWEWKLSEAKESLRKSVELSPDYATAHQWYAISLIVTGNGGGASAEIKRAVELEPKSLAINADYCQILYFLRKYDEALAQCKKTLEMDANFLNARLYLYEIYTTKEMYDEAVAEFFKIEQLKSDYATFTNLEKLQEAYTNGGIRAFWRAKIEFLEKKPDGYELAKYYARLGEKENAMSWLKKSVKKGFFESIFFQSAPVFQGLEKEPQFLELKKSFE